jgi:hypothetical protein
VNLTSSGVTALDLDKAGISRPATGAWDVGAYVYTTNQVRMSNVERRIIEKEKLSLPNPINAVLLYQYLKVNKDLTICDLTGKTIMPNALNQPGIYLAGKAGGPTVQKIVLVK